MTKEETMQEEELPVTDEMSQAEWLEANIPDDEDEADGEFEFTDDTDAPDDGVDVPDPDDATLTGSDAYKRAVGEIERKYASGVGKKVVAAMTPEEVISMGQRLVADSKTYIDQANELDRLKKGNTAGGRNELGEAKEQEGGNALRPSESPQGLDFSEELRPLDTDLLGDEFAPALTAGLNKVTNNLNGQFSDALDAVEARFQAELDTNADSVVRHRLAERFPSLKDPSTSAKVDQIMRELSVVIPREASDDRQAYRSKLMQRALVVVDPKGVVESANRNSSRRRSPTAPTNRVGRKAVELTHDQKNMKLLELLERGTPQAEAVKLAGL